jgi:hypothetical protein
MLATAISTKFATPPKNITDPYTYPMGHPRIVSINALAVADVYALQGADIVATENYWYAGDWLKLGDEAQPRAHLRHYLKHMFHEGLILDRAAIEAMMRVSGSADVRGFGEQSP